MRAGSAIVAVAALLAVAIAVPSPARAAEPADVRILFDIGDGTYFWSDVHIPDRLATNASWQATLDGARTHDLWVESHWYVCCGLGVSGIYPRGWTTPPAGLAGLYVWIEAEGRWDFSSHGISSLVLQDGDAIAWANAGYDSVTFASRRPVPTPRDPYPALSFRADGGNTGASPSKAPNGATLLWDRNLSVREIASSPAVAYGAVYVLTMDGLFALDANTGAVRWENASVRGFSSPTVADGSLFVGGRDGRVYRVSAANGAVQWSTPLVASPGFSGITSSPRVVYDWVYIGTFNESGGPGELVSLWASNGTVAWRLPASGSIHYSTPAFTTDRILVGVMGRYNTTTQVTFDPPYGLLSVRPNGTPMWFFPTGGPVAASPLVHGALAIVPARDGIVYAVNWTSGAEVWRRNVGPSISSAALHGDTVFIGVGTLGGTGTVAALNVTTGDSEWQFRPEGPVQASIAYADGKVFFSTNTAHGTIYALDATSAAVLWTYAPNPADYILGSPVVSNGTLYAPSDNGHVYAFRDTATALANLSFSGPAALAKDQEGTLNLSVRAVAGRVTEARLAVVVPPGLAVVSASPQPTNQTGGTLLWYIGILAFQWRYNVSIVLRAVAVSETSATVTATLTSGDAAGVARAPLVLSAVIAIRVPSSIGWLPIALGFAGVGCAIAAILLTYLRRRRHGAP